VNDAPIEVIMDKIKVLVADDHALFCDGLCRLFEREKDIECVAVAKDGKEAVELTKKFLPDVVLIDVAMPKLDGIEAAKHIRADCPTTVILIVSAYAYEYYVHACIDAGADGYLLKNSTLGDSLINAIRLLHAGEDVFDREIVKNTLQKLFTGKGRTRLCLSELGNRELEILRLALQGMSNKKIASKLSISDQTVGTHFVNIFRKLGVESRLEAVLYAIKKGWVSINDAGLE